MLKKWFISSFPEIEKMSQNLGPNLGQKLWKIEFLMKRCIGSAKTSQNRFSRFRAILRCWRSDSSAHFPELWKYPITWAQILSKNYEKFKFKWKGASDPQNLTEPIFAFSHDITMLKKWFISTFPGIEKISQNLGPNLLQKLWKVIYLMKSCIVSAKPHRTVFRFFVRYHDAEEVIHKLISWNWENISKSCPKLRPEIMKNWIWKEKVHRIR